MPKSKTYTETAEAILKEKPLNIQKIKELIQLSIYEILRQEQEDKEEVALFV